MFKRIAATGLAAGALLGIGSGVALAGPEDPCWNGCSYPAVPNSYGTTNPLNPYLPYVVERSLPVENNTTITTE